MHRENISPSKIVATRLRCLRSGRRLCAHLFQRNNLLQEDICFTWALSLGSTSLLSWRRSFDFLLVPSLFGMKENTRATESSFGTWFREGWITITPSLSSRNTCSFFINNKLHDINSIERNSNPPYNLSRLGNVAQRVSLDSFIKSSFLCGWMKTWESSQGAPSCE